MLSNIFNRLLTSVRPCPYRYQQQFLRLLSTAEPNAATPETISDREKGVVKRFSKDKGYGFISKTSDGTDLFVHFKNINVTGFKTLEQGQEVEFTAVQGEKGFEAKDVNIINTGSSRASFIPDATNNNSTSSKFGFGGRARKSSSSSSSSMFNFGGTTSSNLHSATQDPTSSSKSFNFSAGVTSTTGDGLFSSEEDTQSSSSVGHEIGLVKRWTEGRGFGFIRRSNGGPDLFCHARSLKNGLRALEEGQTVQFTVQKTDKGEEARDVTIFNADGTYPDQQQDEARTTNSTERQTGTVRRWIAEKGYGFVRLSNSPSDMFVHVRNLSPGLTSLEEGQTVEFNIVSSPKGDMADNVTVRDQN